MRLDTLCNILLVSAAINYAILLLWWLVFFSFPHQWVYRLWGRWFRLAPEQFDACSFAGIMLYKIGILLFNLVPYVALRIAG